MLNSGSAYVFERDTSGVWNQVQKIVASDRQNTDYFGASVSISGDHAIVGAFYENHDTTGGNAMNNSGSAYLFERDNSGVWNEVQKIVASDREALDEFGISVSISGEFAVVGARFEDEDAGIRAAAIDSLMKLSSREYAELGVRAIDAVIDMLNDDVEFVRRKAVFALSELLSAASPKIGAVNSSRSLMLTLPIEALETATTLLQDKEPEIRLAVHSLLSNMSFPDPQQFRKTIETLLR
jgi:hypothetical protein